jgi:hypothetical protein
MEQIGSLQTCHCREPAVPSPGGEMCCYRLDCDALLRRLQICFRRKNLLKRLRLDDGKTAAQKEQVDA